MTAASVGSEGPSRNPGQRKAATLFGSLSIFLWATWPSLALFAAPAPIFQILALGQAVGFVTLAIMRVIRGQPIWGMFPRSAGMLVFGVIGVLGTNAFNFLAISRIPAAQASVINYTWPIMALLLAGLLGFEKLHFKHYLAVALGFSGVVLIIDPWSGISFDSLGVCFALLAAVCYASYTTYRQSETETASDAVGIYGLFAAVACATAHFSFETTEPLDAVQWASILALGVAPMGLGFAIWDYGVANGDARAMTIFAYGTPLFSTLLLIALGFAAPSLALLLGACLVIAGAAVGTFVSTGAILPNSAV